jgi:arginine decarboxylase
MNLNFAHVPKNIFFTVGVGVHRDKLMSFEMALRDASIAPFNLVTVSSILPPMCKIVSSETGLPQLYPGQIVFAVLSRNETNENGRLISSAVGFARPLEDGQHGYISEVHEYGLPETDTKDLAEDRAAELLATLHGITIEWNKFWDPHTDMYYLDQDKKTRPVQTDSIALVATGKRGFWTSTIAAAVFTLPNYEHTPVYTYDPRLDFVR